MFQRGWGAVMLLTVKAAAAKAGVCASIVYGWVGRKLLPHFRLGTPGKRGKIAIAAEDLDAFLQARRVGAEQPKPAPAPKPQAVRLEHLRLKPS